GLGAMLKEYPGIDRRRIYLYGGSGGGQVALQVLQCSPQLWSEVHVHSAITKITTKSDVAGNYEEDPTLGWNQNLGFPIVQGALPFDAWRRYEAELVLRGPQCHARRDPVVTGNRQGELPHIWMMHGTADNTVDYQHFLDYTAALELGSGKSFDTLSG